ncbi:MAG: thermonuclease family protein [Planctomycetales bacterium]|nr:thermonuclease family protein [Planctomycetales bacterium]
MGEVRRFGRLGNGTGRSAAAGSRDWLTTIGIMACGFVASAFVVALLFDAPPATVNVPVMPGTASVDPEQARFTLCVRGRGTNCVIDGDTIRYGGDIIRIADIDTPEVRNYGCAEEKVRGDAATARLLALMNAGAFTLAPYERDRDPYGRALRIVTRDGQSLGMTLVAEGLAREWDGARRGWC